MSYRIRVYEPNTVYSVVIRCSDQQFLFKPDHGPECILLTNGCPIESFDRFHDTIPKPSVVGIIGAALARAQELTPINIHFCESTINHIHLGFSADVDHLQHISDFFRNFTSYIAVKLNKKWKRNGHVFGGRYRATPCLDDESVSQQWTYAVTNSVKDHLVQTVREAPFFNTYRAVARGKTPRYFLIDWDAYHRAGGPRKKSHCPQDYVKWMELRLSPLPAQKHWPLHKIQSWARARIREVEERTDKELKKQNKRPMGVKAQFLTNPRSRPTNPKAQSKQPICHCADTKQKAAFKKHWRHILAECRAASIDYLQGLHDTLFPDGTYPPPKIQLQHAAFG